MWPNTARGRTAARSCFSSSAAGHRKGRSRQAGFGPCRRVAATRVGEGGEDDGDQRSTLGEAQPGLLHGFAGGPQTRLAARSPARRQRAPDLALGDAVLVQSSRSGDQDERKQERNIGGDQQRGRRLEVAEDDQQKAHKASQESVPDRQEERGFADRLHGVLAHEPRRRLLVSPESLIRLKY